MKKLRKFLSKNETALIIDAKRNDDYRAHIYLGNMNMALGRFDLAEAEYKRAHAVQPCSESEAKLVNLRTLKQSAPGVIKRGISRTA